MIRLVTILLTLCVSLTSYTQNCAGITDTISICGFEYDLALAVDFGTFEVTCPDTDAHIALLQNADLLHLTVNQCGEYTVTHTYESIVEICTIEDVYTLQFSDPSNQRITIDNGLSVGYDGEGHTGGGGGCSNPTSVTIGGVDPPTIGWENCLTINSQTTIFTAEVLQPNPALTCQVDLIDVDTLVSTNGNEECTEFAQDDFYGVAGVDFFDLVQNTTDISSWVNLPPSDCSFETNFTPTEIDTIIQEIDYYIPIQQHIGWSIWQNGVNQLLQDTTTLTIDADPNYIFIVDPGADYIGPDSLDFQLVYWNGTDTVQIPNPQNLTVQWLDEWIYDTITVVDTIYQTAAVGTCGGLSIAYFGGGIPAAPPSIYTPIVLSFPGLCDCSGGNIEVSYVLTCDSNEVPPDICAGEGFIFPDVDINIEGEHVVEGVNADGCPVTCTVTVFSDFNLPFAWIEGENITCSKPCVDLVMPAFEPNIDIQWYSNSTFNTLGNGSSITVCEPGTYEVFVINYSNGCYSTATFDVLDESEPLNVYIAGSTTFCTGSSTVLDAIIDEDEESSAPYDFCVWDNGTSQSSLVVSQAGCYSVTVTDTEGCTGEAQICVTESSSLAPTITGNTEICEGDITTLNAGAGFSSYEWNASGNGQTINVSTSGTYSVTVSDFNGCTGTDQIDVIVNPLPEINIFTDVINCINTCVDVVITTSVGYESCVTVGPNNFFAQTSTFAACESGTYQTTVTDSNGCASTETFSVDEDTTPPIVEVELLGLGVLTCDNPCITVLAFTDVPPNCTWWGADGTVVEGQTIEICAAGTYQVVVTNDANGCTAIGEVTIIEDFVAPFITPIIVDQSSDCNNPEATLSCPVTDINIIQEWFDATGNSIGTGTDINVNTAGEYIVILTNLENGCTSIATTIIDFPEAPIIQIVGDANFCEGESTTLSVFIENNDDPNAYGGCDWSNGSTNQNIEVTIGGCYSVTVTNNVGCTAEAELCVSANPNPIPVISGATTFCAGTGTTLDAGAGFDSYLWNTGETTQTTTVSYAGTCALTVTDASGCSGTASVELTEADNLAPVIIGETEFCAGESTTLDAGAGFNSYLWNTGETTQTTTVSYAGICTVTVTGASGCSGTASVELTEKEPLEVEITGATIVCAGETTSLQCTFVGAGIGEYGAAYIWSTGETTAAITCPPGCYSVTIYDAEGCMAQAETCVTVFSNLEPSISGNTTFCTGESTTLSVAGDYLEYYWNTTATTADITVTEAGDYFVTVTNADACTAATTISVIEQAPSIPIILGNTEICEGETTIITVVNEEGIPFEGCEWSTGEIGNDITIDQAGTYCVTAFDTNGCIAETCFEVLINTLASPIIEGDTQICAGNSTTLNTINSFATYEWSTGSMIASTEVTQTGTVSLTVTDFMGCVAVNIIDVVLGESPEINATAGTLNCCTPETTLEGTSSITDSEFLWEGPNGFIATEAITNATIPGVYTLTVTTANSCTNSISVEVLEEFNIMPLAASAETITCIETTVQIETTEYPNGTYYWTGPNNFTSIESSPMVSEAGLYHVIYESADCCQSTLTIEVEVNQSEPDIFVPNYTLSCQQNQIVLQAQSSVLELNYQWTNFEGFQSDAAEVVVTEAGFYSLQVTNPENSCTNVTSFVIDEIEPMNIAFLSESTCVNATDGVIELMDLTGGTAPYTIEWETLEGNEYSFSNLAAGDYLYQITDSGDCIENGIVTVTGTAPEVSLEVEEREICKTEQTILDPRELYELPESTTFEWDTGDTEPSIVVSEGGVYSVNMINNCEVLVHVFEVKEKPEQENSIFIPNAFSPNDDGINDIFLPVSGKEMQDYLLTVYDRWGSVLYRNTDANQGWDGKLNDNILDNGVFVFHLKASVNNCKGEIIQLDKFGDLTLIR